jgi:hypothetical protein
LGDIVNNNRPSSVNPSSSVAPRSIAPWKELYLEALFETDKSKIAMKIVEAQLSIVAQRRKVFAAGTIPKERHALDAALLSLQALASCLGIGPGSASAIRAANKRSKAALAA